MLDVAAACVTSDNNMTSNGHDANDGRARSPFSVEHGDATWGMRFTARYLRALDRRRRWVIGVWLILGIAGACAFSPFLATPVKSQQQLRNELVYPNSRAA